MRASEFAAALLVEISAHGDGEMQDNCGWPVTHVGFCLDDSGGSIFNAESDEGCTCINTVTIQAMAT